MSDFSEPSQAQETHGEPRLNSSRKIRLTSEEFAFVRSKRSQEEEKAMNDLMGKILFESSISYGVPETVIGLGFLRFSDLYWSRPAIPFGRARYISYGLGFFAAGTLLGSHKRYGKQMVPIYDHLLKKYIEAETGTNYAAQHYRNPGGADWEGLDPENPPVSGATEERATADRAEKHLHSWLARMQFGYAKLLEFLGDIGKCNLTCGGDMSAARMWNLLTRSGGDAVAADGICDVKRGGAEGEDLDPENPLVTVSTEERANVDRVEHAPSELKLSREQIQYLFKKMSSDEQGQIESAVLNCWAKSVWMIVPLMLVPLAVSSKVSKMSKISRKPWHGLVLFGNFGIALVIAYIAIFKTKGPCKDRIQPTMLAPLWLKYGGDMPAAGISNLHLSSGGDAETTEVVPKNTTSFRLWSRIKSFVRPGLDLPLDWKQIQFLLNKASWDERKDIDRAVIMANAMGFLVGCLSSSALYWDYRKRHILTWSKGYQFVASFFGVIIGGIYARHMCGKSLIRPKITQLQEKYGDASVANPNLEKNVTVEPISVVDKKTMLLAAEQRTNVVDAHTQSQQSATKPILTRTEELQPIPDAKPTPLTTKEKAKQHQIKEGPEVTCPVEKVNKPVSAERRGKMHANMYEMYAPRGAPQDPFDYPYAVMAGTPLTRERQELREIQKNPADDEAAS